MHKNISTLYFKLILYIVFFSFFLIIITVYSDHIELFNKYTVQIHGNKFISDELINEKIENHLEENYFSINLEKIKSEINSLTFVELTQISLLFPDIIVINIIERKPIILITLNDKNFLMDKNGLLLASEARSINYFPVPIINLSENMIYDDNLITEVSEIFNFLLLEYPFFYNRLSEVIIDQNKWTFFSDSKTKVLASSENISFQLNILKAFETTVFPQRKLEDYSYIDLRITDQVIVKEKYRKG